MKNHNIKSGILLTLMSSLSYAALGTLVKANPSYIPIPVLVFFQSLVSLIFLAFLLLFRKGSHVTNVVKTQKIRWHLLRTICSMGVNFFLFYSLAFIPLVDGVLLANTAPFIVPLLAFLFMGKKINHQLWLPLMIGFLGVVAVLRPGEEIFNPYALLALGSGVCMAAGSLLVRKLSATESSETSLLFYLFLSTIITGCALPFFWVDLTLLSWALLPCFGILFFFTQYFLTLGLENISAQIFSITYYSCIIFSVIFGYIIFHNGLDMFTLLGIILICMGGIASIAIQSKVAKSKSANPTYEKLSES